MWKTFSWLVREVLIPDWSELRLAARRCCLALAGTREQLEWGSLPRWRVNLIGLRWWLLAHKCSVSNACEGRFLYAERLYQKYQFEYAERRYLAYLTHRPVETSQFRKAA